MPAPQEYGQLGPKVFLPNAFQPASPDAHVYVSYDFINKLPSLPEEESAQQAGVRMVPIVSLRARASSILLYACKRRSDMFAKSCRARQKRHGHRARLSCLFFRGVAIVLYGGAVLQTAARVTAMHCCREPALHACQGCRHSRQRAAIAHRASDVLCHYAADYKRALGDESRALPSAPARRHARIFTHNMSTRG